MREAIAASFGIGDRLGKALLKLAQSTLEAQAHQGELPAGCGLVRPAGGFAAQATRVTPVVTVWLSGWGTVDWLNWCNSRR